MNRFDQFIVATMILVAVVCSGFIIFGDFNAKNMTSYIIFCFSGASSIGLASIIVLSPR